MKVLFLFVTFDNNWFDTLTVKQCEMMTNNDVLLFPASSEEHHTRRSSSYINGIRTRHWQY